jgi:hypothetical protein
MTRGAFLLHGTDAYSRQLAQRVKVDSGLSCPKVDEPPMAIVNWGGRLRSQSQRWVLNEEKAVERAGHAGFVRDVLSIHGIPHGIGLEHEINAFNYRCKVPVFQQDALCVLEGAKRVYLDSSAVSALSRSEDIMLQPEEWGKLARKAAKLAVRTIYALGLDFGLVTLAGKSSGEVAVLEVQAAPPLDSAMIALYAEAIDRLDQELVKEELWRKQDGRPILGADPEFILRRPEGAVVPASRFFGKKGRVGCDAVILNDKRVIFPLVELRPNPAATPSELLVRLHKTMRIAAERIADPSLHWLSGGMPVRGLPLGGHIHLSGVPLSSRLLRVLDNGLALSLAYIEAETTKNRRPKFGFLGDAKRKSHGGFEYRTPPSWLMEPGIARGVFALMQLLAENYQEWRLFPLSQPKLQRAFYAGDKGAMEAAIGEVWDHMAGLSSFPYYEKDLRGLASRIRERRSWDELQDFRAAWKIPLTQGNVSSFPPFMV